MFHGGHEPDNNAAVLALFEGNDADTPYHHNEEKAEQQNQPQCNHSRCETQDIRIVSWERIGFT